MAHISCQIVLDQEGISNSALLGAVELSATEEIVVEDGFVEVIARSFLFKLHLISGSRYSKM